MKRLTVFNGNLSVTTNFTLSDTAWHAGRANEQWVTIKAGNAKPLPIFISFFSRKRYEDTRSILEIRPETQIFPFCYIVITGIIQRNASLRILFCPLSKSHGSSRLNSGSFTQQLLVSRARRLTLKVVIWTIHENGFPLLPEPSMELGSHDLEWEGSSLVWNWVICPPTLCIWSLPEVSITVVFLEYSCLLYFIV